MLSVIKTSRKLSGPSARQLQSYALWLLETAANNHALMSDKYENIADQHFFAVLDNVESADAYQYWHGMAKAHRMEADYLNGQYANVALMTCNDFMHYQYQYSAWLNGLHEELKGQVN